MEDPVHLVTMDWLTIYLEALVNANVSCAAPLPNFTTRMPDTNTLDAQGMKYYGCSSGDNNYLYDPTLDTIHTLNELLFRAAVPASSWSNLHHVMDPSLSPNQSTVANQTVTRNAYRSDSRWYATATAVEVLIVLAVLLMFWS